MITTVIILGCIAAWALASRTLFRRWVRNDTFIRWAASCSDGYENVHRGYPCHPRIPVSHRRVAAYAAGAALILPVTLFAAFVMSNPPPSRSELGNRTRALEAENARLRRAQDDAQNPEPGPVSLGHDYDE